MRYIGFLLILFFSTSNLLSQETINGTIQHDGLEREYILYIPATYDGAEVVPLVFNFHGYTSNAFEQMNYGDFRGIAERENFLVVHPQGTIGDDGQTFWNAQWGAAVDDIGYMEALIDSLSVEYNINPKRIYSTGMSNGGFMSYTLACELGDRFAAIASVTGSMTLDQLNNTCQPSIATPAMQIHGTLDFVVPFNGNTWMAPIDDVVTKWIEINGTETDAIFETLPDNNTGDGSTVEHYVYSDGVMGNSVELYKVIRGAHTWPGTIFGGAGTNQDFSASEEIWRFFSQFSLDGRISSTEEVNLSSFSFNVFPNPTTDILHIAASKPINGKIYVIDGLGQVVMTQDYKGTHGSINTEAFTKGSYILTLEDGIVRMNESFIKM